MQRENRRASSTLRSVEREAKALTDGVRPQAAALHARARRLMREQPLAAIGLAAAFGWMLGRALGARR